MTPFAGDGINLGMRDSLLQSRAILKASKSPSPETSLLAEINSLEKHLFVRTGRKFDQLHADMVIFH
ncbi:oligopeptide transporter [Penicillium cosmopolitanum]|uniref:Oligopeptide transporter n=1 Tax=Penicillium cosmopolitanum TaxID=1131564 RepID=A0A9W9VRL1_9EURO|nr:oligopeptide transporter [Penicillium cosmopolitanum]KAJ5388058.1 oligopeptide transporter [Penicillium cosmopolitanum]